MIRWGVNVVRRTLASRKWRRGAIKPFPTADLAAIARGLAQRAYRKQHGGLPAAATVDALAPYALHLIKTSGLFVPEPSGAAVEIRRAYTFNEWTAAAVGILRIVFQHLPADIGVHHMGIEVEGWALAPDPYRPIRDLAISLLRPDSPAAGVMQPWIDAVMDRAMTAKGVELNLLPSDEAFPAWSETPVEVMTALFRGTPLRSLLRIWVPITIPDEKLHCHVHGMGTTGSGKTTINEAMILSWLGRKGGVVFDTKGGMAERLIRHGGRPQDILLIDVTDPGLRPLFNIAQPAHGASRDQVARMIAFILAGLDVNLTPLQFAAFEMIAKMVASVPAATIATFLDFLEDEQAARRHAERFDADVKRWLQTQYTTREIRQARIEIARKVWALVGSELLGDLLCGARNTLQLKRLLDARKLVVITVDKSRIGADVNIIARCFVAALAAAMLDRPLPLDPALPDWIGVLDEFGSIVGTRDDSQVVLIATEGRERRVCLQITHQQIDGQLGKGLKGPIVTNSHVKLMCNVNNSDAREMASLMNCRAADMQGLVSGDGGYGYFVLWVNGYVRAGARARIRFGYLQNRPRMDDATYARVMAGYRAFWAKTNGAAGRASALRPEAEANSNVVHLVADQAETFPWAN